MGDLRPGHAYSLPSYCHSFAQLCTIIPVFYNVEPINVRFIKGSFGDAFSEHERKKRYSSKKLKEWKDALNNIPLRSGQILKEYDKELRTCCKGYKAYNFLLIPTPKWVILEVMAQTSEGQTEGNSSAESWLIEVQSKLNSALQMSSVSENVCIYRVPVDIRISKPEAYNPLVVSFGPYHHNTNSELSRMDRHKLEAVRRVLDGLDKDANFLIEEIEKLEFKIKKCYEEPIDLDREKLWMLALDACFILEFFRTSSARPRKSDPGRFSRVFQKADEGNSTFSAIIYDIMKLENQIPLLILRTILELEMGSREAATDQLADMLSSSHQLFRGFPFEDDSHDDAQPKLKKLMMNEPPPHHLLDLYRMVIRDQLINSDANGSTSTAIPGQRNGDDGAQNINVDSRFTPSAELLHNSGIKFKSGELKFEKRCRTGTLFLPQITFADITETLLRNLMAYEESQTCSRTREETVISHFIKLLQDLVRSERDVSVLRKSQVIVSFYGSDGDLASRLNHICDGITIRQIPKFESVMKDAREHYYTPWKTWLSQFKEEYCVKPWYALSIVAAILILVMTAVQTWFAVKKG